MNRAKPTRKILLVLTCALALLQLVPAAGAVGADEVDEPQTAAVTSAPAAAVTDAPAEAAIADEAGVLHAQVVRGLPFSNFDFLALCSVLLGFTILSFAVHRLSRDPAEDARKPQITTDAG